MAKTKTAKPTLKKPKAKATKKTTSLRGFKKVTGEVVEPTAASTKAEADPELVEDVEVAADADLNIENLPEVGAETKGLAIADPVARYMAELRRYPLLTREQEHELAVRYRETGDPKAAEALVTSNLRFVVKVAAEYTRFGARLIDLVQEGNVGLMHAVKEFNPYKGVRLITYAVWWIRGYIQEYLMRQYSMVRIGTTATQRKLFYQLQREREKLERMGLEQGIAQLSGKLGVPAEEVAEMHSRLSGRDVSLDAPVNEDGSARMIDLQSEVDPTNLVDQLGTREEVSKLVEKLEQLRPQLNERELMLLDDRLLADEPLTLQEIGDKYGTTREAVRQMEARLMKKIKDLMAAD